MGGQAGNEIRGVLRALRGEERCGPGAPEPGPGSWKSSPCISAMLRSLSEGMGRRRKVGCVSLPLAILPLTTDLGQGGIIEP